MKKMFIAAVAAMMLSTAAVATNNNNGPKFGGNTSSTAVAAAVSASKASASNKTSVGVGVNNKVSGGDASQSQSMDNDYGDYTPNAYAPSVQATAPCYVGISAGVGVPGFSGALGTAYYDKECEVRETVRLGQVDSNPNVRAMASAVLYERLAQYMKPEEVEKEKQDSIWDYNQN